MPFRPLFPNKDDLRDREVREVRERDYEPDDSCIWTKRSIRELAETLEGIEDRISKIEKVLHEMLDKSKDDRDINTLKSDVKYIISVLKRQNVSQEDEEQPIPRKGKKI